MNTVGLVAAALAIALGLGFVGAPLVVWTVFVPAALWFLGVPPAACAAVFVAFAAMNLPGLRRRMISAPMARLVRRFGLMPAISDTERVALEAGTTWIDAELFSGRPDFRRLRQEPYPSLSPEEQSFVDHQVARVCSMASDWEIFQNKDLPQPVWDYLKKERFFGMIIPKEYGGLGFSALGHSEVIARLATHSVTLCVTCMVPNSLGPAELLLHYGTQKQREYYLPRLARGEEIPCFGLTEPNAGSDAGSIQSVGVVFRGPDGQLRVRLDWEKRYITLAAVSTLIGLAVRLQDPENLLGKGVDLGITCILVPSSTPGVVLGRRHNAMGVPFHNCPTSGRDVVVSIEQIIGGVEGAGRGWQMLMECLAAGRAISLPSLSAGNSKGFVRLASAYAVVRRQFGVPIGAFEGIEEPLARIVGLSYLMEAARIHTAGAVDAGMKPAVVSAICKYSQTELGRRLVNDTMDILAGAGIARGPRNRIANQYLAVPISITVEGANILTRSMIIFGQGAIRCHPFAYAEMKALMAGDDVGFDRAIWGHFGHAVRCACRSLVMSLTRGWAARVPGGRAARHYRKLAWASATFSLLAEVAMTTLGGKLKLKEKLTGRYADLLSHMYLAACVLRRHEAEGFDREHRAVVDWAMQHCFAEMQVAFEGILANLRVPGLTWLVRGPIALWARLNRLGGPPSDALGHAVAQAIQRPGELRDSLTGGIVVSARPDDAGARMERAFQLAHEAAAVLHKIAQASRAGRLPRKRANLLVREATEAGVITPVERELLDQANTAREEAIRVDAFGLDEFRPTVLDLAPGGATAKTALA